MAILNISSVLRDGHKPTGKHISENSDDECVDSSVLRKYASSTRHSTALRTSGRIYVQTGNSSPLQERGTAS